MIFQTKSKRQKLQLYSSVYPVLCSLLTLIICEQFMKPSAFPLEFFNLLPRSVVWFQVCRNVYLSKGPLCEYSWKWSTLQKHQSRTMAVYKWQKTLKGTVKDLIMMKLTKKLGTWFNQIQLFFLLMNFFFLFMAVPVAYGNSWARGWIEAAAAGLHHSHCHDNTGSEPHLRPMLQLVATLDP